MAESRQQLIQGSSFFQGQKEKLGNFMAKRSTITGAAFKKGTSQESSENIEKRVGHNERKITLLKNIFKARKDNVNKKLGSQNTLLDTLQSIAASVDSIRDTLIQRQESGEEGAAGKRVKAEQEEFDKREKGLGKKDKFEGLKAVGSKILKPVMSIWERIWNFIKTLFLGKILLNFLQWFADPANQKKVASFGRFIKNFWPALLTGALLFMTGLGAMITNMTVAIALWIPKMLLAIKSLGAIALAGGAGMMGFGRKALSAFGRTRRFNEGGIVPGSGNSDTVPAMLTPGEVVMNKRAVQQYGADTLLGMNAAAGGNNIPSFSGGKGLPGLGGGGGGTNSLTGQAKVKTSRSALADFFSGDDGRSRRMTDLEMSQRMAGGGLVQHFNEGGLVTVEAGTINSYQDAIAAGIPVEDVVAGNMRFGSIRYREKLPKGLFQKQRYQTRNRQWHVSLTGKDDDNILGMSTEDYVNKKMGWVSSPPRPKLDRVTGDTKKLGKLDATMEDGKKGNRGPLGMLSLLDFMTMGITDFDKQNAVNLGEGQKDNVLKRTAGGVADWLTMGLTDFDKRGQGSLQFNPIGGGEDRKWGGDDKTNLTLADEQETKSSDGVSTTVDRTNDAVEVVTANQISGNSSSVNDSGGAGNEVPSFDVGVTRDVSKIRTLGLMLI